MDSLFDSPAADAVLRTMFCRLYEVTAPLVPLDRIIHWAGVARAFGPAGHELAGAAAFVPRGYFYAAQTRPPSGDDLCACFDEAARRGADVTLIPVVNCLEGAPLEAAGCIALPWFVESRFVPDGEVETALRARLGGERFRRLRKAARLCAEDYALSLHWGEAARERVGIFDELHRKNLAKYGHRSNHFSTPLVNLLLDSPLGADIGIALRTSRASGRAVQACLVARDVARVSLSLIVHGIDHEAVPHNRNLYAATLYDIYRWGAAQGVREFSLGRGAPTIKATLGANVFHVLANYVYPNEHRWAPALRALSESAQDAMRASVAALHAWRGAA